MRLSLLAAALLIGGCAAKPPLPLMLPIADPPVTSLSPVAPREIARVAMFNNSCPVPYQDDDGSLLGTSCGRASVQSHCALSGRDARFAVAAMRGVMPGGDERDVRGPRFYLMIQLSNGRMFTATIPAGPQAGSGRATIIAGTTAGTISAAHLTRLQAIASRDGCLIAPSPPWRAS